MYALLLASALAAPVAPGNPAIAAQPQWPLSPTESVARAMGYAPVQVDLSALPDRSAAQRALAEFLVEVPVRQQLGFNGRLYILDGLIGPEGLSIDLLDKQLRVVGSLDMDASGQMDQSGILLSATLRMAEEGEQTDLCVPVQDSIATCLGHDGTLVIYRGVSGDPVALDLSIPGTPASPRGRF